MQTHLNERLNQGNEVLPLMIGEREREGSLQMFNETVHERPRERLGIGTMYKPTVRQRGQSRNLGTS